MDGLRYDLVAEQITLGGMMLSPAVIAGVSAACSPRDFYRPAHQVIAGAILALHGAGEPSEPVAVAAALARQGDLGRCGGAPYLHTLIASVPVSSNAPYYALIVRQWAVRRRIEEAGTRMAQRAGEASAGVADILAGAQSDLTQAIAEAAGDVTGLLTADAFCAAGTAASAPVIPGLLHAQERVVVVAAEGAGKSTLGRQAWVMTAAGLHMFTGQEIPPQRTLLMDFENPRHILETKIAPLLDLARGMGRYDPASCLIWHRPGGVDLSSPADQAQVTALVAEADPALIVAGPVYKMTHARSDRAEPAHRAVADYLDMLRERHNVVIWLEHHAPMGQGGTREMRPLDWGGWMRWPEFGLSLDFADRARPSEGLRVDRFRRDRDERPWPGTLVRGKWGSRWPWPWEPTWPDGTAPQLAR